MSAPTAVVGTVAGPLAFVVLALACDSNRTSEPPSALVGTGPVAQATLDVSRCSPSNSGFTTAFTHPFFFPATVGSQVVLEGEEHGEEIKVQITVLAQTRNIGGVTTRVIEEREWIDDELAEVSWNYYAQASDGSICYFGEDVDIFGGTAIVHDGAWCGVGANQPGIFLPVELQPGTRFQMEVAPTIAMDEGRIVGTGPTTVPLGRYDPTLRVREFNPLDGDVGFKTFAQGVGLIVDGPALLTDVNLTTGIPEMPVLTVQSCGT